MRILQVTSVDFTVQKFLLPLVDALRQEGHEVDIACRCGKYAEELRKKAYSIIDIPFSRNINIIRHLMNVLKLCRVLRAGKYDCLHVHTPIASIVGRLAGRLMGVPVIIYTAHGFYFHEQMHRLKYLIVYWLEKIWGSLLTDYIFFQSYEDYNLASNKQFNRPGHLLHIGNGVSRSIFNPDAIDRVAIRHGFHLTDEDLVMTFVGRMVKEKGLVELLGAYRLLKPVHPELKLFLVGGAIEGDRDGVNLDEVLSQFSEDEKKDVYCLGIRDDIAELLSAADLFVLPSYREGLPRSIIEAMAMCKPIVATNIRGCREEVQDGYNGSLCNVKDTHDLASKISRLIQNRSNLKTYGDNSRKRFLSQFDEQIVIDKQLSVYRKFNGGVTNV